MTEDQYSELHDLICDLGKELQELNRGIQAMNNHLERVSQSSDATAAATGDVYEVIKRHGSNC